MKKEIQIKFGRYIHKQRLRANLSLRKFAKMVKISPTYISKMEKGIYAPPFEETILKMAEILKLDKDELLILGGKILPRTYNFIPENPKEWLKICRELKMKRNN